MPLFLVWVIDRILACITASNFCDSDVFTKLFVMPPAGCAHFISVQAPGIFPCGRLYYYLLQVELQKYLEFMFMWNLIESGTVIVVILFYSAAHMYA
uniref:Putative secreted protein n=1 Tax=Amblyomma triste TaxID=251400 RepID=A0A023G0A6_AMBTT